jgi:hypothetical protein
MLLPAKRVYLILTGVIASDRREYGNLIRKNAFLYMRLLRFTRNDKRVRLFHFARSDKHVRLLRLARNGHNTKKVLLDLSAFIFE